MYPAACMVSRCTMSRQCTDKHEAHTLVKEGIEQAAKPLFGRLFCLVWRGGCMPKTCLLKSIQIKRDNPIILAAATTPSSNEE